MTRALSDIVRRVRTLGAARRVRFTWKALRELASLGLDARDACEALEALRAADFVRRIASGRTGERLYLFKPRILGIPVYLKFVLRDGCVVVSFHEDENQNEEDGEDG